MGDLFDTRHTATNGRRQASTLDLSLVLKYTKTFIEIHNMYKCCVFHITRFHDMNLLHFFSFSLLMTFDLSIKHLNHLNDHET